MIHSFKDSDTANFYNGKRIKHFESFAAIAERKLKMLKAAKDINDLRIPPANRLEALHGDRKGQFSIRINNRYRVCFRWEDGAHDVEIVDYH